MGQLRYSIVVPVFNKVDYLKQCLDSILGQMKENDELILIDDGSSDGSEKKCDQYAEMHSCITVIHQQNSGVSRARNTGIKKARGKHLLFIDCDDTLESGLLSEGERVLHDHCRLMIFGMAFDYYENHQLIRTQVQSYPEDTVITLAEGTAELSRLFETNSLSSSCNKIFEAELIQNNGLQFNEKMYLYEDLDFVLRYLSLMDPEDNIAMIRKSYYHYRLFAAQSNVWARVADLNRLLNNLHELKDGFEQLAAAASCRQQSEELYAKLYASLIYSHLFYSDDLKQSVHDLLTAEKQDLVTLNTKSLDTNSQTVLSYISTGDAAELKRYMTGRRIKSKIRKTVKKLAGK